MRRSKRRIWIIAFSNVANDPRVMRQIWALCDNYELTVFGHGPSPAVPNTRFIQVTKPSGVRLYAHQQRKGLLLLLRRYEAAYWSQLKVTDLLRKVAAAEDTRTNHADLVLANDLEALPAAVTIAKEAPVVFDAHEYFLGQFEHLAIERLLLLPYDQYLCGRYIPRTTRFFTVSDGLAEQYEHSIGLRPVVMTNAPPFRDVSPSKVPENSIRLVHHGAANPSRRIERMIQLMDHLDDRFHLDLMLVFKNKKYEKRLKRQARQNPRIRFVNPVPMTEIVSTISHYDIGLYLLQPYSTNARYALPNKFFEFIQARLAIAIGPSVEMARIVKQYGLGIVGDSFDPQSLAERLNQLTANDIMRYKEASTHAAKDLNFEQNSRLLQTAVATTIQNAAAGHE